MNNNDIIAELTKELIKDGSTKLDKVLGGMFPYYFMKRDAVNMYLENIYRSDLPMEIKMYNILNARKEIKRIKNIKTINELAMLDSGVNVDFSNNSKVSDTWLEHFYEESKDISDEKVSIIWAKLLSTEFQNPGSTPPSIIRVISGIDAKYAKIFSVICNMCAVIKYIKDDTIVCSSEEIIVPCYFDSQFYLDNEITFSTLNELESLGLIKCEFVSDYIKRPKDQDIICEYYDFYINLNNTEELPIGSVMLTEAGKYIKKITEREKIDHYCIILKKYYTDKGLLK